MRKFALIHFTYSFSLLESKVYPNYDNPFISGKMNVIKVQYEIHDVVPPENAKKVKGRVRKGELPRSQTSSVNIEQKRIGTLNDAKYRRDELTTGNSSPSIAPLPKLPTSSHYQKRNSSYIPLRHKSDWNMSLTVPDRDLLIMEQDLLIDQYKSRHEHSEDKEQYIPRPSLSSIGERKVRKQYTSEEHRDRVEHHSFGAAINDPLPFHPYLRNQNGIHNKKWINDSKLPVEHEDWAKPTLKANKTHDAFLKEFKPEEKEIPPQDISMKHSFASIVSTYSKVENSALKEKNGKK